MISFACPHCKKTVNVPERESGRSVDCPHCNDEIRVPANRSGGGSGVGLALGIVALVLVVVGCPMMIVVSLAAISVLGQKASGTFTYVGNTIGTFSVPTIVHSTDGNSQITVPGSWATRDLNKEATIQVGNEGEGGYIIVLTEPKTDFAKTMTYLDHAKLTSDRTMANCKDVQGRKGPKEIVINGRKAVQYEFTGMPKDTPVNVAFIHTTVEGKDHFHQVLAWTLASRIATKRSELESAINSFRETDRVQLPR